MLLAEICVIDNIVKYLPNELAIGVKGSGALDLFSCTFMQPFVAILILVTDVLGRIQFRKN